MKRMLFAALALMPLIAGPVSAADEKPSIVTVLTAPEPQTQLMAMVLSMQSIQQGAAVRVLLCGPAGDLALKDAPPSATAAQKPKGISPQGLMQKIIATGAPVEVCAIYLPNKGVGPDALIEGVAAARPPEMAGHLLADDARLLTF
ncbi:MAG: hypothetical protein AAF160_02705 [Pseudomonadota bacterium]